MRNYFKELRCRIRKYFAEKRALATYEEAVKAADEHFATAHERTYVMLDFNGDLVCVTKDNINTLKSKGRIPKSVRMLHIEDYCLYCTPYPSGKGKLTPEKIEEKKRKAIVWMTKCVGH